MVFHERDVAFTRGAANYLQVGRENDQGWAGMEPTIDYLVLRLALVFKFATSVLRKLVSALTGIDSGLSCLTQEKEADNILFQGTLEKPSTAWILSQKYYLMEPLYFRVFQHGSCQVYFYFDPQPSLAVFEYLVQKLAFQHWKEKSSIRMP